MLGSLPGAAPALPGDALVCGATLLTSCGLWALVVGLSVASDGGWCSGHAISKEWLPRLEGGCWWGMLGKLGSTSLTVGPRLMPIPRPEVQAPLSSQTLGVRAQI